MIFDKAPVCNDSAVLVYSCPVHCSAHDSVSVAYKSDITISKYKDQSIKYLSLLVFPCFDFFHSFFWLAALTTRALSEASVQTRLDRQYSLLQTQQDEDDEYDGPRQIGSFYSLPIFSCADYQAAGSKPL